MKLEIGLHLAVSGFFFPRPADAPQLIAKALAIHILARIGKGDILLANEHARAEHGRMEPGAFFIGPVDHDDRMSGADLVVIECTHQFKPGQNPEHAIIFAACRHGIQM